ncbi:quinone oxidoreductase family protein [Streptomyces sp.]|uniref:quinone oxidoreductase family protein n=1 Tax=Streptomyces sp. TaxID=1931 RepID=UPI002F42BDC2
MRAIVVTAPGGPEVLRATDVPEPVPGPGEALVRIHRAGVNFIDTYYRSGAYPAALPLVPGQEAVGVVERLGDGTGPGQDLAVGDRVAWATRPGTYAEYAAVPLGALVPVPDKVTDEQAAAGLMQGLAAHYLVHDTHPVGAGDTVVVHAAAGGLGRLAVQFAASRGATVIATVSVPEKAEAALSAGARHVVVRRQQEPSAAVRELTGGRGADVVYDSIGAPTFEDSLSCLRPRGLLVLCGASGGQVAPFALERLRAGSLFVTRPSLADHVRGTGALRARAAEVFAAVASGVLELLVSESLPLERAREAHTALESGTTTGKLLLHLDG